MKNFIKEFRQDSKDNEKPYFFAEKEIQNSVNTALKFYSRKKPIIRECNITIVEGQKLYALPEDYQTWYKGLEKYAIVGNCIVLKTGYYGMISFLYYADRKITEIPESELYLFYSFCYGDLLEKKALKMTEQGITDGNLKTMKLGRGLELTFEEGKNSKELLLDLAKEKKQLFFDGIKGNIIGSWC